MKLTLTLFTLSLMFVTGLGCDRYKKVAPDEVISATLTAYCARMLECDKSQEKAKMKDMPENPSMTVADCEAHMRRYIPENKDFSKLEVTSAQLKSCVDKISKRECKEMLYGSPLKECNFLN